MIRNSPPRPVNATCVECGDVTLTAADITMHLLAGTVEFECPVCGRSHDRPSRAAERDTDVEVLLLRNGARLVLQ